MSEKTAVSIEKKKVTDSRNSVTQTERSDPFHFSASPVERILFLQKTIGNHAVERLVMSGKIQTKLKIGHPGDKYEQEADRVAENVMRMPEPQKVPSDNFHILRACTRCEENDLKMQPIKEEEEEDKLHLQPVEEEEELQAKTASNLNPEVDPGSGNPLSEGERAFFEPRFGYDFSNVRVHSTGDDAKSARAVNARAYTVGNDVVFGTGEYAPATSEGQKLMAHELTHVVQQTGEEFHRKNVVGGLGEKFEKEPKCNLRQIKNIEKFPQLDKLSLLKSLRLQREVIRLVGWGTVPEFADSSIMRINPRASLWISGRETQRKNFSRGARERITIPLGSDVHLKIAADIYVLRDRIPPVTNDENTWHFDYTWRITVDNSGALRMYPPTSNWNGGTGSAPWSVQGNAIQGERSAGIALTLGSTESRSSGHEIPIIVGGAFEPFGVGIEGQIGYTYTWGTSTGSTLTAGRGFVIDIETPEPSPQITVGPITIITRYAYYFNTNQAVLGTNPITGADENISLTNFLRSLDPQHEGGRDLSGFVDGYASPTGGTELNRDLARRRANYILRRIQDTLPLSRFSSRIYGEDIWRQQGIPEVDNSERHRVVLLEIRQTPQAD